ncbi:ATP-grasp domain-containing protein [Nitrosococcus wardiae]|uniref:ATP-grasp domain-containing protein n=1 Tax=Nitrosococcus wardiae TaxID=1814290 RepID=A0A4P7C0V6_9GAMM|nr:ATP-grasp domain-containing protein [Nitrosococcus wardiae]QBQ54492.1 ATP-grasp domain-containing protein [Nitrosococcus wardiae]
MKRILFLGAAPTQIPPIRYALAQGHYVITCDYLPSNPGHRLAHEWHNVSTTDKDAVLDLARNLAIDGIVAYASDPSAPTGAYVAEHLGLPGNPYQAVLTLARKDLFRRFLSENGFNVPRSGSFYSLQEAIDWASTVNLPVFVKPIDSSGSKGLTFVNHLSDLEKAFDYAQSFSREKVVVIEEQIEKSGYQIDSDVFMVDGKLQFWQWGDQHQDPVCNPYAPISSSYPSIIDHDIGLEAARQVERLLNSLSFKRGAFNVEFLVDINKRIWILEIGARNGGKNIPIAIKYATGVDLIKYTVDAALGEDCSNLSNAPVKGFWSNYTIHSRATGTFKDLWISNRAQNNIVEQHLWIKPGQTVMKYRSSSDTLGTMIMRYDSMEQMLEMTDNMEKDVRVIVE